jgi:cysteine desulfurase/selenocysteine lyase
MRSCEFVQIFGPADAEKTTSVVSFNIRGISPSDAALFFDEEFNIMSRPGLHCAPAAHRTIKTFPTGSIRFSFGCFNTTGQLDLACAAIEELAKRHPCS